MNGFVTLIWFIIIFSVVVVSHEFGHFIIARMNGIHVVEFSVGMGPNIFSVTRGDTKYSLKLFPIGGACMFEGEDGVANEDGELSSGAFPNAPVWGRIPLGTPRAPQDAHTCTNTCTNTCIAYARIDTLTSLMHCEAVYMAYLL